MSTNQTANLNLHLWEAEDAFLRTEFNENSERLDEAYAELKTMINKNHSRISEGTLTKDVTEWNMDFSFVPLTNYWKMEVLLDCPLESGTLYLRINNLASGYTKFGLDGTATGGQSCLAVITDPGKQPFCLEFSHMNEGTYVSVHGVQFHYGEDGDCWKESLDGMAPVLWEDVASIQLVAADGVIPSGTRILMCAMRK